jgi:hypothetical protein
MFLGFQYVRGLVIWPFLLQLERKYHQHGRCEQVLSKQEVCQCGGWGVLGENDGFFRAY